MTGPQVIMRDMLEHPEDWVSDVYTIANYRLGVSIWVGNGISFYGWYGNSKMFGHWTWLDQFRMSKALKKWGQLRAEIAVGRKINCPLCRDTGVVRAK